MTHYFTILSKKDKDPEVPREISVDVVGLRENVVKEDVFTKRKIVATFNMFFNKGYDTVVYVAPNQKLTKDPLTLYDVEDADATVFRFEKILSSNPKQVSMVWDVAPPSYVLDNVIIIKNRTLAKDWLEMTSRPYFKNYNELDVLNMITYYGGYKIRIRDISEL